MALHPAAMMALVPATIVAFFAFAGAAGTVPQFFDPCHQWGTGTGAREVALDEDCPSRSGSSQTRGEAAFNLVAISGVLLVAAASIVVGAFRLDRAWTGAGATLIAVMVPPFGLGIMWVPALVLAIFAFAAAASFPRPEHAPVGRNVVPYGVAALGTGVVAIFLGSAGAAALVVMVVGIGTGGVVATWAIARPAGPTER